MSGTICRRQTFFINQNSNLTVFRPSTLNKVRKSSSEATNHNGSVTRFPSHDSQLMTFRFTYKGFCAGYQIPNQHSLESPAPPYLFCNLSVKRDFHVKRLRCSSDLFSRGSWKAFNGCSPARVRKFLLRWCEYAASRFFLLASPYRDNTFSSPPHRRVNRRGLVKTKDLNYNLVMELNSWKRFRTAGRAREMRWDNVSSGRMLWIFY